MFTCRRWPALSLMLSGLSSARTRATSPDDTCGAFEEARAASMQGPAAVPATDRQGVNFNTHRLGREGYFPLNPVTGLALFGAAATKAFMRKPKTP